jgi:hypothetical protein
MYMPNTLPFPEFWITDKPGEVFPSNPLYTVTSSLALEGSMQDSVLLRAPVDHEVEEIQTHRGLGLTLFSEVMYQFGFTLGRKDECLWLGSQIDGEQFKLEDEIAQKGPEIDTEILSVFFDISDVEEFMKTPRDELHLHPQLQKLVQMLYDKIWHRIDSTPDLLTEDPIYRKYADHLLDTMYRNMGIRDGWYNAIEKVLRFGQYTHISSTKFHHPVVLEHHLIDAAKHGIRTPKASHAIVIGVDPTKLFESIPAYVFPLSGRPPDAIVPAPMIPLAAVSAIYSESVITLPEHLQGLQKSITELDTDKWLADHNGRHIDPTQARAMESSPTQPLCAVRYANNPISVWANHIAAGNIAPWWNDIRGYNLGNPQNIGEQCVQECVLAKAYETGLLGKLIATAGDVKLAQEQFLGQVASDITLPSIKSVKDLEGVMLYTR